MKIIHSLFFCLIILISGCSLFIGNDSDITQKLNVEVTINDSVIENNESYNAGTSVSNQTTALKLTIKNNGNNDIQINKIYFDSKKGVNYYFTDYLAQTITLPYNESITLHFNYNSNILGYNETPLFINITQSIESNFIINLNSNIIMKPISGVDVLLNYSKTQNQNIIDLGSIIKNTQKKFHLIISNPGSKNLTIFSATISGSPFISLKKNITALELSPGEYFETEIIFSPLFASNNIQSTLTILSNDSQTPDYTLYLNGVSTD